MRQLCLLLGLLMTAPVALAQTQPFQTTRDWMNLSGAVVPLQSNTLFGFDAYQPQTLGTSYEDSTFRAGNIRFYGKLPGTMVDSLMGVPIRYDLHSQQLEIRAGQADIRTAQAPRIRYYVVSNPFTQSADQYVNVREFRGEADALTGFFEVVVPGRATLLRHPLVKVQKASYNAALNVGSRDDKLLLKETWYAAVNSHKATEFTPGKRALLALFADKEAALETYLKTQKPDLKSRAGLIAVFSYYNSL